MSGFAAPPSRGAAGQTGVRGETNSPEGARKGGADRPLFRAPRPRRYRASAAASPSPLSSRVRPSRRHPEARAARRLPPSEAPRMSGASRRTRPPSGAPTTRRRARRRGGFASPPQGRTKGWRAGPAARFFFRAGARRGRDRRRSRQGARVVTVGVPGWPRRGLRRRRLQRRPPSRRGCAVRRRRRSRGI